MTNYREETTGLDYIVRTNENGSESWIPKDLTNSDYQRYLRWLNGEEEQGGLI